MIVNGNLTEQSYRDDILTPVTDQYVSLLILTTFDGLLPVYVSSKELISYNLCPIPLLILEQ